MQPPPLVHRLAGELHAHYKLRQRPSPSSASSRPNSTPQVAPTHRHLPDGKLLIHMASCRHSSNLGEQVGGAGSKGKERDARHIWRHAQPVGQILCGTRVGRAGGRAGLVGWQRERRRAAGTQAGTQAGGIACGAAASGASSLPTAYANQQRWSAPERHHSAAHLQRRH